MTRFSKWVEEFGGPVKLAYTLGVSDFAVRHWLNGLGTPKVTNIQELIKLSKGKLTFEDIVAAKVKPKISKKSAALALNKKKNG